MSASERLADQQRYDFARDRQVERSDRFSEAPQTSEKWPTTNEGGSGGMMAPQAHCRPHNRPWSECIDCEYDRLLYGVDHVGPYTFVREWSDETLQREYARPPYLSSARRMAAVEVEVRLREKANDQRQVEL